MNDSKRIKGVGLGTTDKQAPICVKLPPDIDTVVRSLPNRSDKIRQWIIEGMRREGLLPSGEP
ncbi:hypothetical protein LC607_17865 [Nostoc sp. CHAB 5824]|nr:hypothetical protein [Nostoc sp. CHAB 5824]